MKEPVPKRLRPRASPVSRIGLPRDLAVLQDLALASILTTGQIERLAFPSRRRAQRRLRAYLDHGLVRACLQGEAMHRDSVWTLTSRGLEYLADHGAEVEGVRTSRPNARSQKLSHALLARELTVSFLIAERRGELTLRDLRHDAELASEPAFVSAGIVPDGLALVEIAEVVRPIVWEAVSSRQPIAQVRAKLLAYERATASGLAFFRDPLLAIIFVLENAARRERLVPLVAQLRVRTRTHVLLVEEAKDVHSLLARIDPGGAAFMPLTLR